MAASSSDTLSFQHHGHNNELQKVDIQLSIIMCLPVEICFVIEEIDFIDIKPGREYMWDKREENAGKRKANSVVASQTQRKQDVKIPVILYPSEVFDVVED
ncbi:hypothetical protein STEG23_007311 [Scotinomys teguina]